MNDPSTDELEETEKINVVPLADLTLVLLIVLMVLAPMVSQSMIHVATPAVSSTGGASETPAEAAPEPLLISISKDGYKLNNAPTPNLEVLKAALAVRISENSSRPVIVTADDSVKVGRVVEVVDTAKQVGASQISLVKSVGTP